MSIKLPCHFLLFVSAFIKTAMTLTIQALLIVYSLLFLYPAVASTQEDYFDNMITLKVGSYLTLEFYEVKSDFDGGIYLDIKELLEVTELNNYSQFSIEDGTVNLLMAGSLFADNKDRQIQKTLKSLDSITIDERLYLDQQGISELFPLEEINWLAESYTLQIIPKFNLPLDYQIASQRRKRAIEKNKNNQQSAQQNDLFMPEDRKLIDFGMLKLRYDIDDISNHFKNGAQQDKGDVEAQYSSQLLYGDFTIRQNLYSTRELENISLKYPYIFKDKTVTLGDSFIQGNDILGYNSKIRGFSVSDNGYTVNRSGREITIRGEAPKNATVEIYQNGKITDYQDIDGNEYEFTLATRSHNDAFKIKIYDRNGVFLEERDINVMRGRGLLDVEEWDYNFFYGQNPQGDNKAWDDQKYGIAYGVTNNLTYALDYYDTRNEDKLYQYSKHMAVYRFSNLFIPLVTQFSYYDSFLDNSEGYIGELKSELFSHKLSYSYERYSHQLAQDENKDSYQEAEMSGNYGRSDYFFRFSSKQYQSRAESIYDTGLSYDVSKAIRINVDLGKTVRNQSKRQSNYKGEIGFDYNQGDFTYNIDANYDQRRDAKWRYTARLRKRLRQSSNYAFQLEVSYDESDDARLDMSFEYKFNDFFKTEANYRSNREQPYEVRASYEKVINMKNPFMANNSKYPDRSYLEGTVFIDKNGNGQKEHDEAALAGVGVRIGQNQVKTSTEGAFYLSDISPYRSHNVVYDYSGTMLDPTLRVNTAEELILIPASGKKIAVGLVPLSLVMGSISLPKTDSKTSNKFFSYAEIVVEKDGIYHSSIKPEYDGFYVLQDLKPGKYNLEVNYPGSEIIVFEKEILSVVVLSGETGHFYEDIDFNVTAIKAKKNELTFENIQSKASTQKTPPLVSVHIIKKGETLYQLTIKYGLTLSQLLLWNPNVVVKKLFIGAKIKLGSKVNSI
jgi:LysM repeat protein